METHLYTRAEAKPYHSRACCRGVRCGAARGGYSRYLGKHCLCRLLVHHLRDSLRNLARCARAAPPRGAISLCAVHALRALPAALRRVSCPPLAGDAPAVCDWVALSPRAAACCSPTTAGNHSFGL